MNSALSLTCTRQATAQDAELVYNLYCQTPDYFDNVISIPLPTLSEVTREIEVALQDPRRRTELVLEPSTNTPVGYLDYKLDYPEAGDATVNLLLIPEPLQSQGHGQRCIRDLEMRLAGRAKRILASIYGENERAKQFWKSLGYTFAIDAKPVLDWYAKDLEAPVE